MIVEKSPNIIQDLEQVRQHVDDLNSKYEAKKELSKEIQRIIPVLERANKALTNAKIASNSEVTNEIEKLLNSLNLLRFTNDAATQIKVNALQANLFANFLNEITKLKTHLDRDDWKAGRKVKNTQQSKGT